MFARPPFLALAVLLIAAAVGAAAETEAPLTDERVGVAIDAMKGWLYERQRPDTGTWEKAAAGAGGVGAAAHYGGETALAVQALLAAGESSQNPRLRRALAFLESTRLTGTYETAARAMMWARMPDPALALLERDALWLLAAHDGAARFRYRPQPAGYDNSATHFAMLGIWEAARRGIDVPELFWRQAQQHFLAVQNRDGGWAYTDPGESKASMTAAGLTVLLIAQEQLHRQRDAAPADLSAALERGFAWLDEHARGPLNVTAKGANAGYHLYYLYALERAGLAGGRRFIAGDDWFQRGTRYILDLQNTEEASPLFGGVNESVVDTAFALLFLARGRQPVWITKLDVPGTATNQRPNDVARLTDYLSRVSERQLHWQRVSVDVPSEGWGTPVVWLASGAAVAMTDAQRANLQRFLDHGGTLIASPESHDAGFSASVRELGRQLYPQWPMRQLEPEHPLFTALHPFDAPREQRLFAVGNGARELIVLASRDWGRTFQADERPGEGPSWRLAANLFTLLTDAATLSPRLEVKAPLPRRPPALTVAQASYPQRSDGGIIEPQAWPSFAEQHGLTLQRVHVPLDELNAASPRLVHLAGVEAIELTEAQRNAINAYVRGGGTLLIETVGGRGDFTTALEAQLNTRFNTTPAPLPRQHPIITGLGLPGSGDQSRVTFRRYSVAEHRLGPEPRLLVYMLGGRPAIILAHEDFSLGLLNVRQWAIHGYDPASARGLMTNLVLWVHVQPRANIGR